MHATIWHNPSCGTSRNTLGLIRAAGIEPTVIDYRKTPPDRDTLRSLVERAGVTVREAIRSKEAACDTLGLADASLDDEALIDALLQHPELIQRPFVETPLGVRLCRPAERVLEILPR